MSGVACGLYVYICMCNGSIRGLQWVYLGLHELYNGLISINGVVQQNIRLCTI